MYKIESLIIDGMKAFEHAEFQFDDINIIIGKNGSGKTTIIQAIQLCLLGYIPGIPKRISSIFELSNNDIMKINMVLKDGSDSITIEKIWSKSIVSSKLEYKETITPEGINLEDLISEIELPVFNYSDFISMSSNAKKDWFLRFLKSDANAINMYDEIAAVDIELPDMFESETQVKVPNVIRTAESLKQFNSELKDARKYIKGCYDRSVAVAQSAHEFEDDEEHEITSFNLEHYTARTNEIRAILSSYSQDLANIRRNETTENMIKKYEQVKDDKEDEFRQVYHCDICNAEDLKTNKENILKSLKSKLESTNLSMRPIIHEMDTIQSLLASVKDGSNSIICPYLSTDCEHLSSKLDEYRSRLNSLSGDYKLLQDVKSSCESEIDAIQKDLYDIKNRVTNYNAIEPHIKDLTDTLVPVSPKYIQCTIDSYKSELAELQEEFEKFQRYYGKQKDIELAKYNVIKYKAILQTLKELIELTDANHLGSRFNEAFQQLESLVSEQISAYFGSNYAASFRMSTKSNSFEFGLVETNSNVYISYDNLSSGEKCMYAVALLFSLLRYNSQPINLIILDDVFDHLDSLALSKVIKTLNSSCKDIQFIIAGVLPKQDESLNSVCYIEL